MNPIRFFILIVILIVIPSARAQSVVRQLFPDYSTTNCVCYTNKLIASTNAARVLRINTHNADTVDRWLHVFDLSTNNVPTNGSLPTLPPLKVTAGATGGWDFQGVPEVFRRGVIVAPSETDRAFTNAGTIFFIRVSYDGKAN